jgi:SAM-dependent methyltransferase
MNAHSRLFERGAANLPPPALRTLVSGRPNAEWFRSAGEVHARAIAEAASVHGYDIEDPQLAVLDFGCGSGRTTRHWQRPVHGTDINVKAIRWCQRNLPGEYTVNGPEPPTAYPDARFDLVYAVSVFTHLTIERQERWLAELARIIRPGGLLLLSTHGDELAVDWLTDGQLASYRAGEIIVWYPREEGSNICAVFHPEGALGRLTADFEVLERRARALNAHDVNVLRRR